MKVLAIDPGFGRCGVAVLEKINGKEQLIFSDCIETSSKDPFPERLGAVIAACTRIMKAYAPGALAIEKVYFSNNAKTAMQVAEVRGAIIGMASTHDVPVFEYTPGQVKNASAGYGGADKKAVIKMLHALIKIEKKITHDDEYDAIAVALTHLARVH